MLKAKVFSSERFNLEEEINGWLSENPEIEVVNITQSQCGSISEPAGSYEDLTLTNLTVIIWHKTNPPS